MLDIKFDGAERVVLQGRFDASTAEHASNQLDRVNGNCEVDFAGLDYISSAGLGVLLKTQKRLSETGHALKLVNLNAHIKDVFFYAGFNAVFDIE
jgi:anti-anti-sigma factor